MGCKRPLVRIQSPRPVGSPNASILSRGMATMAVRTQHPAFLNFCLKAYRATLGNEPADVVGFVANVIKLQDDRVSVATDSARVGPQVVPDQDPVALLSRETAWPAFDTFVASGPTHV